MTDYPWVGIGILNWNGRKYLEQFLPSVTRISYPFFKVYVIDNASSDDSVAWLKAQYPSIKIIETGGNLGFAGGYNHGFAAMPEPYVLMLNSDVEVTQNFLEPLVEQMLANPEMVACQSKLLSFDRRNYFEYGGAAGGMMDFLGYSFCRGRIFDTVEEDLNQYPSGKIFWSGGACSLLNREAYLRMGGMYTYFFMHFEEIDLCWRMQANGYQIGYCNQSVVYHVGGGTLSYSSPGKTYYNFRNNLVMVWRNAPWTYLVWWVPLRAGLDLAAMLQFLLKKDGANARAVIRAYGGWMQWLLKAADKWPAKTKSLLQMPVVLKQSIVWLYIIKKRKTFQSIKPV